ncbi:hypothetical protein E2C01_033668 [Portunus trituberculatus]|uniref:Uncharacterized protein n=1 Tax=Portunus trituberculatus TaxID=210409 RepID=A0A5B7F4T8_PORTR|nr:hypothetical protein [Portunus trituberculatus]
MEDEGGDWQECRKAVFGERENISHASGGDWPRPPHGSGGDVARDWSSKLNHKRNNIKKLIRLPHIPHSVSYCKKRL